MPPYADEPEVTLNSRLTLTLPPLEAVILKAGEAKKKRCGVSSIRRRCRLSSETAS